MVGAAKVTLTTLTTLGRLTLRHENGLSYNALGQFRLPVPVMLLSWSTMLCMSLVGTRAISIRMICMPFSCRVSDLTCWSVTLFKCEMQRNDGLNFTTRGQVHMAGGIMPWLPTGHVSLCLEEIRVEYGRTRCALFTFLTRVCSFVLSFHLDSLKD